MASLTIPRNSTNSFTRAVTLRDELYERLHKQWEGSGMPIIGYKSMAHEGEIWLRIDYALPPISENLTLRSSLTINIARFDFHRFEHVLEVKLQVGERERIYRNVLELSDANLAQISQFLQGTSTAMFRPKRLRVFPIQLWRPRNKVIRVRPDWASLGLGIAAALCLFIPLVGLPLALALVVALIVIHRIRKVYVLTTGKPAYEPRALLRMDSWQSSISSLGLRRDEIHAAIERGVSASHKEELRIANEHIWYPGVDGKVEREQLVLSYRRAVAFVHLERHGDDLYVAWDAHVNIGAWTESSLARGIDRETGKPVVANRVAPGLRLASEYDLADSSFLGEWLHANLTKVLKLSMEEHRIDQEIDFTVNRESRRDALGNQAQSHPNAEKPKRSGFRLKRVA
jgi:hypothetical protein